MPYTTIVAGNPILASWANTNVRDQVVYRNSPPPPRAASAITTPVVGMPTYLQDTKSLEVWDGTYWSNPSVPTGTILDYAGATVPSGWLLCDGTTVRGPPTPELFALVGTTFNTGGEAGTVFRLPDLRGRAVWTATTWAARRRTGSPAPDRSRGEPRRHRGRRRPDADAQSHAERGHARERRTQSPDADRHLTRSERAADCKAA